MALAGGLSAVKGVEIEVAAGEYQPLNLRAVPSQGEGPQFATAAATLLARDCGKLRSRFRSVLREFLRQVDYQNFDRTPVRFKPEAELLLHCSKDRRPRIVCRWRPGWRERLVLV